MTEEQGDPLVGREIHGFRIEKVIGRGGMGVVYRAEQIELSRTVALKRIDPALARDEGFLRRFRSEARALARVTSPHIVAVHDFVRTEEGTFIVMEYVDGRTLTEMMREGPLPWKKTVPLVEQMVKALERAHSVGVVHRDVKPSNIMLTEEVQVKVADFGLAKVHTGNPKSTVTRGTAGTLHYMSPEQVKGLENVDHRSDLYSLGITIYEMLAGRLPYDREQSDFAIMQIIVEEDIPDLARFAGQVPRELRQIVMKAVAKNPEDRFQTAQAMREAVEKFREQFGGHAAVAAPSASGSAEGRSYPKWLLGTLVVLLAGGLTAGYHFIVRTDAEPSVSSTKNAISVSSIPGSAAVYVNGDSVGNTPLNDYSVSDTSLFIELRRSGYQSADTTIASPDGRTLALTFQLTQRNPENESKNPEVSNVSRVEDGPSTVADSDRGRGASETTTAETENTGRLRLTVKPAGTITVAGRTQKRSGTYTVSPGPLQIRFEHPTYGSKDTTVTVTAGADQGLTCYFEQILNAKISASPLFSRFKVYDADTGEEIKAANDNKIVGLRLEPGRYRIHATADGGEVVGGRYYRDRGQRLVVDEHISGNVKDILVKPTFEETVHRLVFQVRDL